MVTLFSPKQSKTKKKEKSKVSFEGSQTDGLHAVTLLENGSRLTVDVFIKTLGGKKAKKQNKNVFVVMVSFVCESGCGIVTFR